ncbi:hypothetical protein FLW16_14445 [Microbispora sp. KK1-11]|nr:hypothetical protein FLW16_14445 [Microbispora sp. KK1-11]
MHMNPGMPLDADTRRFRPAMQWELRDSGPMDGPTHIQVGSLRGREWYVDHMGFGARRFPDKHAAWAAIRRLMAMHQGRWEQVPCTHKPFYTVRRSDGSRVLYDQNEPECLYGSWGTLKERRWETYCGAFQGGTTLRRTETHSLFEGAITLTEYRDPFDDGVRFVLERIRESGGDWRVIDYPSRDLAETRYEQSVRANAGERYPYKSSDVEGVPVDRVSADPPGIRRLASGAVVATADLAEYERLYGRTEPR